MRRITLAILTAAMLLPTGLKAQQTLSLEDCRQMAIANDDNLSQARTKYEMAGYDKKIAFANYLPNISATGAYLHSENNINLLSDSQANVINGLGANMQGQATALMTQLQTLIQSDPAMLKEYASSPMWQNLLGAMSKVDLAGGISQIGQKLEDALELDIHNNWAAGITATQPLFMGGKIVAANKIAALAEQLQKSQYDQKYQETLVAVDQSYWQIISVANKLKLADSYADLLHDMENDVDISIKEGVATESDGLQIKVKANEADMLKTKAENGLVLAKMLLCKQIGLPLDSDIKLADEDLEEVPLPQLIGEKSLEDIYADRPETQSLEYAGKIYDYKADVAEADMLPQVALTAGYIWTNPNVYNGFQNDLKGNFGVGVVVRVPIFHGMEALNKTRKAKAEATLYKSQLSDAKKLINLQVTQLRKQQEEALKKYSMAKSNLDAAEENLRKANIGFEAGVVDTNTALAAQTAWLQAHSEFIDAGIEMQMNNVNIQKTEGNYRSDLDTAVSE